MAAQENAARAMAAAERGCGAASSFTGFDRSQLPDPEAYYQSRGLQFRERRGKWRTTGCPFHGSTDSLRVNLSTGAFVCMSGCGAKGGDLVAFEMAISGSDFVTACRRLGAWLGPLDERQRHRSPAQFPARDALKVLTTEANLVAIAACNVARGVVLTDLDRERLLAAAARIRTIGVAE